MTALSRLKRLAEEALALPGMKTVSLNGDAALALVRLLLAADRLREGSTTQTRRNYDAKRQALEEMLKP